MQNGISIYPGLDNTLEENLNLIEQAASHGISRLFTSLHIPETDVSALKEEFAILLRAARSHGMEIISDISPRTLDLLGMQEFSLSTFRMLGISTLRLDYGYDAKSIADLSNNRQHIRIQLNASTITGKILTTLIEAKTNFANVDALHNFYPRPGTGISEETLVRKTMMLHKAGMKVGAFVPSQGKKRGPLFDGLPTMEDHRGLSASIAARHLVALGIDSVFLGDSLPTEEEIQVLSQLSENEVILHAHMATKDPVQQELLCHSFTSRIDEARDAIRAQESRGLLSGPILPEHTCERPAGSITIDNEGYLRYMGELEILKYPLPADPRVNVAGYIDAQEAFLLDYITPGRKFSFQFTDPFPSASGL